MDYSMIVLGIGAEIIFIGLVALLYRINRFIEQEPDVALKKLFLKPEALKGFKVLALSNALLAVPLAVESIAMINGDAQRAATARYLMPLPMIGYLYFYIQIYDTVKPYGD